VIASVSLEAGRELIDGALYYAREANAELGLAFITEFERPVGVLCTYPRLGPVWRGSTRRSIIYQLRPDEVRVIALAHQSRKPGYWRGRK